MSKTATATPVHPVSSIMAASTSVIAMTSANAVSAGALTSEGRMEEALHQLRTNINRYSRANDRRMILRSLKEVKFLNCLSLDPVQPASSSLSDLEKELAEETIILNGIPFRSIGLTIGGATPQKTNNSGNFLAMLRGLCAKLCDEPQVDVDHKELYESLVLRMARTTSSADPYFRLNSLMGSSELLLMPLSSSASQIGAPPAAAGSSSNSNNDAVQAVVNTPIYLNLYVADGQVHMTLSESYDFGLFRKSDVKSGKPWISIHGLVNERSNFSNNQSVRSLNVKLPDLY
jgi:hypothetical protein